jgi:transglutaminase-like putative cysteine protease
MTCIRLSTIRNSFVRLFPWLPAALLLSLLVSPAFLRAQFQQPTDEELKMTSDPKAPGAAAVYLYVEETTNDPQHYFSFYARVKILTEKGKEQATVELPYIQGNTQITDIKARTIHSDGSVIPLSGKPEDILAAKTVSREGEFKVDVKVFNLPSVEVGSILEYRYELRYPDRSFHAPFWKIQGPYFVHKAHYAFIPARGFFPGLPFTPISTLVDAHGAIITSILWSAMLPPGTPFNTDKTAHVFSVDLTDIPPIPDEEWMPPIEKIFCHVNFYYTSAHSGVDYWAGEYKLWSKDVDHFAEPSKAIKQAVFSLVALTDSDLDKAKKLYKAVQALDNTNYSRKKSESEIKQLKLKEVTRAEDVWNQKSGSSHDIALLYLAMLRAAGLTAYDMKVVNRNRGDFDQTVLNFSQLDDDIIILKTGGKEIFLDPGEKMCPFQTVHWKHSGATGLRQGGGDAHGVATTPEQTDTDNKTVRKGDITLDEHGAITGRLSVVITGQVALLWRQIAMNSDLGEFKKQFDRVLGSIVPNGVEAHVDHFDGLDDPEAGFTATVDLHGSLGVSTAKRLLIPGFFFQTRGGNPFVNQPERKEPVDMHYPDQVLDQIVYHLPANMKVEGAPSDANIQYEDHASLVAKSQTAPGQITISRAFTRSFTTAYAFQYDDIRSFYQKVAAADQAQLVLAKTPPVGKGN